jgi:hypothetical protein
VHPLMTSRILAAMAIAIVYALHQDIWFWRTAHPLVFGFMPIGLAYHALYCGVAAVLMWVLTKYLWPRELDEL